MVNKLAKYRRVLLFTELVGLIHDIGKLSGGITKNGEVVRAYVNHLLLPYVELGESDKLKMDSAEESVEKYSQYTKGRGKSAFTKDELFDNIKNCFFGLNLSLKEIFPDGLDSNLQELFEEEDGTDVNDISFLSLFIRHHFYPRYNKNLRPNSIFTSIIAQCDSIDSREERIDITREEVGSKVLQLRRFLGRIEIFILENN